MINRFRKCMAITLLLVSAISLTASGIWIYTLYQNAFKANEEVIKSYQTLRAANRIILSVDEAAIDVASLIISGDMNSIAKLAEVIVSIKVNLADFSLLIEDDPIEIEMNKKLTDLVDTKIEFLKSILKIGVDADKTALAALGSNPNRLELTDDIHQLARKIKQIENGQLEQATPEYQLSINEANRYFILLGIFNILLILFTFVVIRPLLDLDKYRA